jgi:hypothetical protein
MTWQCPKCGFSNDDSILRCVCGHELDTPLNDEQGTLLQNRGNPIVETDFSEIAIDNSLPQTVLTSTFQRLRDIILFVMFTRPVYIFSWIALIGLSILRIKKWIYPFLMPPFSLLLLILIVCGIITANIAKRRGKSPLLWFINGLIPIGISFLIALHILCIIVFYILAAGEL